MKKILFTVLIWAVVGAVGGALILGLAQWWNERWQTDPAEVEKWVSIAVWMGSLLGGLVGALVGLVIGAGQHACQSSRSTDSN